MNRTQKIFAGIVLAGGTYYFGVIWLCLAIGCVILVPAVLGGSR